MSISLRRRSFFSRTRARVRVAFLIWAALVCLALVLFGNRYAGPDVDITQVLLAGCIAAFAGMLSYFAWLMFAPTIKRTDEEIPVVKFVAGLVTLIPPCMIGISLLPIGSTWTFMFAAALFAGGCFALMTPAQEYLFAFGNRRRLSERPVNWSAVRQRPAFVLSDFSRFDFAPTHFASDYVRTTQGAVRSDSARAAERLMPSPRPPANVPAASPRPVAAETKLVDAVPTVHKPDPPRPAVPAPAGPQSVPTRPLVSRSDSPRRPPQAAEKRAAARRPVPVETRPTPKPVRTTPPPVVVRTQATETTVVDETIRRYTDHDGTVCIEGIVVARFRPGQKRAYAHVSFEPPFDSAPEVVCENTGDAEVRVRDPQVFSYGTRLEVTRRRDVSEALQVPLAVLARGCSDET